MCSYSETGNCSESGIFRFYIPIEIIEQWRV